MNNKKTLISGFLIFVVITITILSSCGGNDMRAKKALNNFSKIIESEDINDLSLTIYYVNPYIFTGILWGVNDLIRANEIKIVIKGSDLEEHIDLLKQISNADLKPVKMKSDLNARLYYVFETNEDGKILDVAMWGGYDEHSIFINEVEVEENDIFYDVATTFLPENERDKFNEYLGRT